MKLCRKIFSELPLKKGLGFLAIFFLVMFSIVYYNARNENRSNYNFIITKIKKSASDHINVANKEKEFDFFNFDSFRVDIKIGDSIDKKHFPKIYIFIEKTLY